MNLQVKTVVLKVLFDLLSVHIVDIEIRHGQDAPPMAIAVRQLGVLDIENAVEECEVVGDLLISLYVEALLRLGHGCLEVRHVEYKRGTEEVEAFEIDQGNVGNRNSRGGLGTYVPRIQTSRHFPDVLSFAFLYPAVDFECAPLSGSKTPNPMALNWRWPLRPGEREA